MKTDRAGSSILWKGQSWVTEVLFGRRIVVGEWGGEWAGSVDRKRDEDEERDFEEEEAFERRCWERSCW